jgi:hypothetical protein
MEEQPGHRLAEEQKPVEEIRGGYTDPKRCVKCEVDKPLSEYYTYRNNGHFYYRSGCKGCSSAAAAAWNNKHRDRINQLRRKRYNNDPGVMRARSERERRPTEIASAITTTKTHRRRPTATCVRSKALR